MKYKELYCAIYYSHNDFGTIRYERMEIAMKKLTEQDGSSLDVVIENLEALKAIFPEAFTEGMSASGNGQAGGVDFEVLRQLLGNTVDVAE